VEFGDDGVPAFNKIAGGRVKTLIRKALVRRRRLPAPDLGDSPPFSVVTDQDRRVGDPANVGGGLAIRQTSAAGWRSGKHWRRVGGQTVAATARGSFRGQTLVFHARPRAG
jgi:hypothetical protein